MDVNLIHSGWLNYNNPYKTLAHRIKTVCGAGLGWKGYKTWGMDHKTAKDSSFYDPFNSLK